LAGAFFTAVKGIPRLARYLAIYGVGALVAYSLIPYKTPWCIISLLWPFFFLFGYVVDHVCKLLAPLAVTGLAAILLLASMTASIWLNFFRYINEAEPYVYVQT